MTDLCTVKATSTPEHEVVEPCVVVDDAREDSPLGVTGINFLLPLSRILFISVQEETWENLVYFLYLVHYLSCHLSARCGLSVANSLSVVRKTSSMVSNMLSIMSANSLFS